MIVMIMELDHLINAVRGAKPGRPMVGEGKIHPVRHVRSQSHIGNVEKQSYGVKLPSNTSYVPGR